MASLAPADVQASLLELTAASLVRDLIGSGANAIYVCGGGALNTTLMGRLRDLLALERQLATVETTDALGVPPLAVEATAFAWLALRRTDRLPGNLASVTGARGERVLGAVYAASGR